MSQHGAKRFHSAESDVVLFRYSLARPRYPGGWASGKLGSLRILPRLAAPVPPIVCSAIRTRICNSSSSSSWAMSASSCSRRTATSYVRLKRYIASPYLLPFPECRPVDHREILAKVRQVAHLHLARWRQIFMGRLRSSKDMASSAGAQHFVIAPLTWLNLSNSVEAFSAGGSIGGTAVSTTSDDDRRQFPKTYGQL